MESTLKNHTYYILKEVEKKCLKNSNITVKEEAENLKFCPTVFDGIMCWKNARAGQVVTQSCSSNEYVTPTHNGLASLLCKTSGKWFTLYPNLEATANYTLCGEFYAKGKYSDIDEIYIKWLPILRKCTHVGYAFSIISLLFALFVFIYLKRLHCARNYLHIHLFISSIMRSVMSIIKDILFTKEIVHLFLDTHYEEVYSRKSTFWICKFIISFRQYFILTNYMMLLMEGIYLHNLIFSKLFSDKTSVKIYAVTGWVLPLIFVIPWVALKWINHSSFCWSKKDKTSLLLEIPTGTIVTINFILFLIIVRVLCSKLNSIFLQQRKVKYRKLVKATLILLPLFGVPYIISLILSLYVSRDKTLEIVWLFFDQSFTAFQGFLAALSYCLLNGDVQTEIRRRYHSVQEKYELKRCRTISHTLQSSMPNAEDFTEVQVIESGKFETTF